MKTTQLLLVFFSGLLLFFLTGRLIGHIIGLDKYFRNDNMFEPSIPYDNSSHQKKKNKKGMTKHHSTLSELPEGKKVNSARPEEVS